MLHFIMLLMSITVAHAQAIDPIIMQNVLNAVTHQRNNALNEAAIAEAKLAKAESDNEVLKKQLEEAKKEEKKE